MRENKNYQCIDLQSQNLKLFLDLICELQLDRRTKCKISLLDNVKVMSEKDKTGVIYIYSIPTALKITGIYSSCCNSNRIRELVNKQK